MKIILLLLIITNFFFVRLFVRKFSQKTDFTAEELEDFVGTLILSLQTGRAFENSFQEEVQSGNWATQLSLKGPRATELVQILKQCRAKPAQSLKILCSFRDYHRLRARFEKKAASASVQAKAQAIVSAGIYAFILVAQNILNPDFCVFFDTSFGRGLMFLSLVLLVAGIYLVFFLSHIKETRL